MAKAFEGRHVAVTGGTGALGAAVVARLLDEAATCHVPVKHGSAPANFAHASHERVRIAVNVDLADAEAVDAFYAGIPQLWASIHIAGGFAMAPIAGTDAAALRAMLDINLVTCVLCSRAAVGAMAAAGGRIVNVAARPALEPRTGAGMTAYTASKAAVAAFTEALAQEVVGKGILVNAVAPSIIDTPGNREAMPDADHGKWASPSDIARTIAFLASPENTVTRGAIVPVYGRS
jgi:NAD(P)-dependent dehydrogenase (short-subunit alcohol dehydrogenase family)